MAYVTLKRSRNTRNYYLLASRRDPDTGKVRKTVLAYLGTEESGLSTPKKAQRHWERELGRLERDAKRARGEERRRLEREAKRVRARLERITIYSAHAARKRTRLEVGGKRKESRESDVHRRFRQIGKPVTAEALERELKKAKGKFAKEWRRELIRELGFEEPGRVRIVEFSFGSVLGRELRRKVAVYSLGARDFFLRVFPPSPWFDRVHSSVEDYARERGWKVVSGPSSAKRRAPRSV